MTDRFIFWTVSITAAIVSGWMLAVRPNASMRGIATPVSALAVLLAVLLVLLAVTGNEGMITTRMRYAVSGH